jgi:hypothetical protein
MQTLSPSVDRIGAALRALRQTHAHDGEGQDKISLGAKCLQAIIAQLGEEGVRQEDLQPLIDLEAALRQIKTKSHTLPNRRKGRPPSEVLLARGAALIDLLIKAGHDEGEAAQVVMRRLVAAGVPAPEKGGDARGWKRLLAWRADLAHSLVSKDALREYREFSAEIDAIPAHERVKRVLDERLWDRRRAPR